MPKQLNSGGVSGGVSAVGGHYKFHYNRLTQADFFKLCLCADYLSKHVFSREFQSFFYPKYWDYMTTQTNGTKLTDSEMAALDWLSVWRVGGEPYSMEIVTKCNAPYCQCTRFLSSTVFRN